jgi:hypothetical protein
MVKYFSEKAAPAIHDGAAKKEAFGIWKEHFLHDNFLNDAEALIREMRAREGRAHDEAMNERKIHAKARSDVILKYFSSKVAPVVNETALQRLGFDAWKTEFLDAWKVELSDTLRAQMLPEIEEHLTGETI